MEIKNYTAIDLDNLDEMKMTGLKIDAEVGLTFASARALHRLNECKSARRAVPHFKAIVRRYYRAKAAEWLNENGYKALPSEFDEWEDWWGAAQAHVMRLAGIEIRLYGGWFEVAEADW